MFLSSYVISTLTLVQRMFLEESGKSPDYKSNSDELVTRIMRTLSTTSANEIDGKLSDALRNFLFDFGEDLAGRNIFRGRDIGLPTYAGLAKCYGISPDRQVKPPNHLPSVVLQSYDSTCQQCSRETQGQPLQINQ